MRKKNLRLKWLVSQAKYSKTQYYITVDTHTKQTKEQIRVKCFVMSQMQGKKQQKLHPQISVLQGLPITPCQWAQTIVHTKILCVHEPEWLFTNREVNTIYGLAREAEHQ